MPAGAPYMLVCRANFFLAGLLLKRVQALRRGPSTPKRAQAGRSVRNIVSAYRHGLILFLVVTFFILL
jgi:hypothetical protein